MKTERFRRERLRCTLKCFWHDKRGCEDSICDFMLYSDIANDLTKVMDEFKLDAVDVGIMAIGISKQLGALAIKKKIWNYKHADYPDDEIEVLMNDD